MQQQLLIKSYQTLGYICIGKTFPRHNIIFIFYGISFFVYNNVPFSPCYGINAIFPETVLLSSRYVINAIFREKVFFSSRYVINAIF